ncbi:MAG: hypothetical protein RR229_02385 [Oscillospiraceae bacterium]
MINMFALNSTDVRKDFSAIVDKAVREKPQFIKRTRDYMILSDVHFFESLLSGYSFTAEQFVEDDGSVTLSLNELDIIENSATVDEAKQKLSQSILDYSEDFYKDFSYWGSAPNRKSHIPYVFKALALDDTQKIGELIICQDGKN